MLLLFDSAAATLGVLILSCPFVVCPLPPSLLSSRVHGSHVCGCLPSHLSSVASLVCLPSHLSLSESAGDSHLKQEEKGLRRDNDGAKIANVDVELSTADDDMRVNMWLDSLAAVLGNRACTSRDALSGLSSTIREHGF